MRVSAEVFACHSASCRPPTSGGTGGSSPKGTIGHIRGDIARERKTVLAELDKQGLARDNPLRHIFESRMGNTVAVVRDPTGKVVGGVQYDVSKSGKTVTVTDMRILPERGGYGTAAFKSIAKIASDSNMALEVTGAVESAKPFYAKLGAIFLKGYSTGRWTKEARDGLAKGQPIPGHPGMDWEDWSKIDL